MTRPPPAELEHDRQMAAIHQARSEMPSLSREEREAHHRIADRYARRAQRAARIERLANLPTIETKD